MGVLLGGLDGMVLGALVGALLGASGGLLLGSLVGVVRGSTQHSTAQHSAAGVVELGNNAEQREQEKRRSW